MVSVNGQGQRETRAESTISTNLEPISAAERTGGLPCVDLGVGGGGGRDRSLGRKRKSREGTGKDQDFGVWGAPRYTCRITDFDEFGTNFGR